MKYTFLLLITLTALTGCKEDFFNPTLELPTPDHDPILAVTSFISSRDSLFVGAQVTRTYGLFEERPNLDTFSRATVELYENGDLLYNYEELEQGFQINYAQEISDLFGGVGNTYELRVSHPDYPSVSATQKMPESVPLTDIKVERNIVTNPTFGGLELNGDLEFTLNDPPGEENFYELILVHTLFFTFTDADGNEFEESYGSSVYFDEDEEFADSNPNTERGSSYTGLLLRDTNFDGQEFRFSAKFTEFISAGGEYDRSEFRLLWRCVSPDYFRFSKSLNDNQIAEGNPFAEPVSLFSNIEGGVGAFCLFSEAVYEIE